MNDTVRLVAAFTTGLFVGALMFGFECHAEDVNPCGIEALYAGMIMSERQYRPENREKVEEDFAEAIKMAASTDEQLSVIQMHEIFEAAYSQLQGLSDDEKDKITSDFVTETYNTCKATK